MPSAERASRRATASSLKRTTPTDRDAAFQIVGPHEDPFILARMADPLDFVTGAAAGTHAQADVFARWRRGGDSGTRDEK
jgi:hypothetical protein